MKIAVTRCDGDTEILTLQEPVKLSEAPRGQACLHSAEGLEHFFRVSDGRYDGWGCGAPAQGWTPQQGQTFVEQISGQRQIVPVTIRGIIWQRLRKKWQWIRWWYGHLMREPGF